MKNLKNYSFALMLGIGACGFMPSCSSEDDVKTEVVTGSQEALNAACKQWRVARAHWEKSEAFLFGAADEYSIDPHTDTWPVDQAALANVLRDQSIMSDIENKVRLLNSGLLGYHGICSSVRAIRATSVSSPTWSISMCAPWPRTSIRPLVCCRPRGREPRVAPDTMRLSTI